MPDATPAPVAAAPLPVLNLNVGDRVVYPNQGLCAVTDIKTEEIAGQKLVFVSLTFLETGAKVKVPKDKLAKNGVRRVASPGRREGGLRLPQVGLRARVARLEEARPRQHRAPL
jgi:hypothetical protein